MYKVKKNPKKNKKKINQGFVPGSIGASFESTPAVYTAITNVAL
jgi:hypothetical protein